jgi:hypothetical protein
MVMYLLCMSWLKSQHALKLHFLFLHVAPFSPVAFKVNDDLLKKPGALPHLHVTEKLNLHFAPRQINLNLNLSSLAI